MHNLHVPNYPQINLSEALKSKDFKNINFGKLSQKKFTQINKIRKGFKEKILINRELVIPKNVVKKLYEKRMLMDKMSADDVADLLYSIFHSHKSHVTTTKHNHIQALINARENLSRIGFISLNPKTEETVVKSGYKKSTKSLKKKKGPKGVFENAMGGRATPPSDPMGENPHTLRQATRFSDLHGVINNLPPENDEVNKKNQVLESSGNTRKKKDVHFKQKRFVLQGRYTFQGFPISIETKRGQTRKGIDPNGETWSNKMDFDYGYIRRTNGLDNEGIDVYVGKNRRAKYVYVVKQHKIEEVEKWKTDFCPDCKEHVWVISDNYI